MIKYVLEEETLKNLSEPCYGCQDKFLTRQLLEISPVGLPDHNQGKPFVFETVKAIF